MKKGVIYDIQGFSVHDGPGIRTTFFLKGCPLRCRWCHNPEGLKKECELQYICEKCIMCHKCEEVCKCHSLTEKEHLINRGECKKCFDCTKICPSKALNIIGQELQERTQITMPLIYVRTSTYRARAIFM